MAHQVELSNGKLVGTAEGVEVQRGLGATGVLRMAEASEEDEVTQKVNREKRTRTVQWKQSQQNRPEWEKSRNMNAQAWEI